MTQTTTIREFITRNALTMKSVRLLGRMDGRASDWDKGASHWQVGIYGNSSEPFLTSYSMGSGIKGKPYSRQERAALGIEATHRPAEPQLVDVLDSLRSDASSAESARDFADFASDFGMDADSISAKQSYRECKSTARRLRAFLGRDEFEKLMTCEAE